MDLDHPLVDSHTLVSFSKESLPAAKCALHLQTRSPKSPQDTPAYAKHNVDYLASSQPRSESIHASTVLRPTSTECSQGVICSRRGNAHLSEAFSRSNVTSQEDKSQAVVIPNTNPWWPPSPAGSCSEPPGVDLRGSIVPWTSNGLKHTLKPGSLQLDARQRTCTICGSWQVCSVAASMRWIYQKSKQNNYWLMVTERARRKSRQSEAVNPKPFNRFGLSGQGKPCLIHHMQRHFQGSRLAIGFWRYTLVHSSSRRSQSSLRAADVHSLRAFLLEARWLPWASWHGHKHTLNRGSGAFSCGHCPTRPENTAWVCAATVCHSGSAQLALPLSIAVGACVRFWLGHPAPQALSPRQGPQHSTRVTDHRGKSFRSWDVGCLARGGLDGTFPCLDWGARSVELWADLPDDENRGRKRWWEGMFPVGRRAPQAIHSLSHSVTHSRTHWNVCNDYWKLGNAPVRTSTSCSVSARFVVSLRLFLRLIKSVIGLSGWW